MKSFSVGGAVFPWRVDKSIGCYRKHWCQHLKRWRRGLAHSVWGLALALCVTLVWLVSASCFANRMHAFDRKESVDEDVAKRNNISLKLSKLVRHSSNTANKQLGKEKVPPPRQELLLRIAGTHWVADIGIGSPPQILSVVFDTGSAELWVASQCSRPMRIARQYLRHRANKDTSCPPYQRIYNISKSDTSYNLHDGASIHYGAAEIYGATAADNVSLGNLSLGRLTLHPIRGGSAGWPIALQNGALEGIFGMAGVQGKGSILDSLFAIGLRVFAFDFVPRPRLAFCEDTDHCLESGRRDIQYAIVNDDFYWQVEANISVGKANIGVHRLIFDTGTPGLTFDPAHMPNIFDALGGNFVSCGDPKIPAITYTVKVINGGGEIKHVDIQLEPHMFLRVYSGSGKPHDICTPDVIELEVPKPEKTYPFSSAPAAMLGSAFFMHFFTIFSLGEREYARKIGWIPYASSAKH